jgi:hypothetical protein
VGSGGSATSTITACVMPRSAATSSSCWYMKSVPRKERPALRIGCSSFGGLRPRARPVGEMPHFVREVPKMAMLTGPRVR